MENDIILLVMALVGLFLVVASVSTNFQQTLTSPQFWVGFVIIGVVLILNQKRH